MGEESRRLFPPLLTFCLRASGNVIPIIFTSCCSSGKAQSNQACVCASSFHSCFLLCLCYNRTAAGGINKGEMWQESCRQLLRFPIWPWFRVPSSPGEKNRLCFGLVFFLLKLSVQQGSTPHPLSGSKNKSNAFIAPQNIVSLLNDVCYCVFHCCRALELVYNEIQTQWERKEFAHDL